MAWLPWTHSRAADEAFAADVEAIKAECRRRREEYRHVYDAATRTISDSQYDHDREAWRNGEGEL